MAQRTKKSKIMENSAHPNQDNTVNFMYFLCNHPHDFIHKVWAGSLANHFQDKFNSFCKKHPTTRNAIVDLFFELDRENQNKLLNWVNENYKSFSCLKL